MINYSFIAYEDINDNNLLKYTLTDYYMPHLINHSVITIATVSLVNYVHNISEQKSFTL